MIIDDNSFECDCCGKRVIVEELMNSSADEFIFGWGPDVRSPAENGQVYVCSNECGRIFKLNDTPP